MSQNAVQETAQPTTTAASTSQPALKMNALESMTDFVPLSDSEDESSTDMTHVAQPTSAEVAAEAKADATEEAEAYDDYDGHFDNPTESTTPVPVPVEEEKVEENQLAQNTDFIAFSDSDSDSDDKDEGKSAPVPVLNDDNTETTEDTVVSDFPWIINHDHSKQVEIADWLTLEIKDFVAYISPSKAEIEARNITIGKIRNSVSTLWPDADLHVFGSYATDLYLPGSDIDCVVNSEKGDKNNRNALYQLANHLSKDGLATEVEVISKTRVPIIKFVEPESHIHIDVSFERTNGVDAAKLIRSWLDGTPGLRELVLIVKQFLHARKLNNVHTGGLGGFSIICLVYSFLNMHPRILTHEINAMENLGVLLIDFFELYGKNFGYDHVAISVLNGVASYLPKASWREIHPLRSPFSLAIQDPGDAANNISRGSFNIRDIKKAFAGTFDMLTNQCFELNEVSLKGRKGKSVLGSVIKYRGKQRDFKDARKLVENTAIVENEEFHNKRSRSDFEGDSDVASVESSRKKSKKQKRASDWKSKKASDQDSTKPPKSSKKSDKGKNGTENNKKTKNGTDPNLAKSGKSSKKSENRKKVNKSKEKKSKKVKKEAQIELNDDYVPMLQ